jgi:5'-nucleotidase
VSLDTPEGHSGARDYTPAAEVAASVARKVIQDGLPRGLVLNVNVPYGPRQGMRGVAITRQGLRVYRDELVRRQDPRGRPYYWIGGESPSGLSEPDTDFWALRENYISITPLQLDLTATDQLPLLRAWGPVI